MAYINPALATPSRCTADFSLIPIGSQSISFAQQIADIQRLIQQSGLKFQMHATGTTHNQQSPGRMPAKDQFIAEGPWDQVVQLIGFAHTFVHQQGIARVQTDIRIQTRYSLSYFFCAIYQLCVYAMILTAPRTDKVQPMEGNVASVERILSVA
ncbi:cell wall biogenesis protein [Penicillium alfredii]|uniref:Cell wall biogenesis protein n=1 Tax=Penicillium alfredii TaxID=1506179 RepID=A0A9W9EGZ9_9EURO|nr:cell wall biogenesis protein [Penicillium alfredii]KAJ5081619.1 cell wall biogenesis protein [Penicillium alfredii]